MAFSGNEAERLVYEYRNEESGYCYRFTDGNQWREIILALVKSFYGTAHNMDELRGYLYLLFSRFPGNTIESDLFEKSYLEQAETYIRHNYSYPIQIADVARFIGIDRTYLYRIFVKHKGVSPKRYLTQYRVFEAKRLLEDTSLSITETALSCGFHDARFSADVFKKQRENLRSVTGSSFKGLMKECNKTPYKNHINLCKLTKNRFNLVYNNKKQQKCIG